MALAAIKMAPSQAEKRNFQRVRVKVYGRYMLEDRSEHPCQIVDMSPGDAALRANHPGQLGEKVIVYLDHIGRVEGVVTRLFRDGFAMTILASERKREKLAAQLTWLANRHELDLPEDRRHDRIAPRNPLSKLRLDTGEEYRCRIIDLSLSGAAVEVATKPELGAAVTLGAMRGRVVRHFDDGVAVDFALLQREETLAAAFSDP
jgi:hypothetical protein